MTWIIKKVNSISTHCGVAYESVSTHLLEVMQLEYDKEQYEKKTPVLLESITSIMPQTLPL